MLLERLKLLEERYVQPDIKCTYTEKLIEDNTNVPQALPVLPIQLHNTTRSCCYYNISVTYSL